MYSSCTVWMCVCGMIQITNDFPNRCENYLKVNVVVNWSCIIIDLGYVGIRKECFVRCQKFKVEWK